MDTSRGEILDQDASELAGAADAAPRVENDERRLQVRAYNFWAGLLGNRTFPDIADLKPESLSDFGPRSVLLDFTAEDDIANPVISYLGDVLAKECGGGEAIRRVADVPSRSLLSRITDHYMQILGNEAPIGFEAEFVNNAGVTILYRGILLPFSRSGHRIEFIYGVINWKERAEPAQKPAGDGGLAQSPPRDSRPAMLRGPDSLTEWADGPAELGQPPLQGYSPVELPLPGFAMEAEPTSFEVEEMGLADWLASAREFAMQATSSEERSHQALYAAIGRAYDFALVAAEYPEDTAELVEDAGLKMQSRAPLLPLVKLVFGSDYDKTRLTEFATAIAHGRRIGLTSGMLADHLDSTPGGLKAILREERRLRREEDGRSNTPAKARERLVDGLRAIEARPLDAVATDGEEFSLLVTRRTESGEVVLLGEVSGDDALFQRAARHLLG